MCTCNGEVAGRRGSGLDVTGAVQCHAVLSVLAKQPDAGLLVREAGDGELEFKGKGRSFAIVRAAEGFLPVARVEAPGKWHQPPGGFLQAIGLIGHCVSSDESKFILTCVNIATKWVEACDNYQAMRCDINTGLKKPVLVRGTSLANIVGRGMNKK